MANSAFASNGLAGAKYLEAINPNAAGASAIRHRLGQRQEGTNGAEWIYCLFPNGVTGPGYAVAIDTAFNGTLLTTANAGGQGTRVGIAPVAIPAGYECWVQFTGPVSAMLAAGTSARAQLNTTANPGVLGSDATAGSVKVNGIVPLAAQAALGLGACTGPAGFATGTPN